MKREGGRFIGIFIGELGRRGGARGKTWKRATI